MSAAAAIAARARARQKKKLEEDKANGKHAMKIDPEARKNLLAALSRDQGTLFLANVSEGYLRMPSANT